MYLLSKSYLDELEKTDVSQYSFEAALDSFLKDHDVRYYKQDTYLASLKYPWHLFEFQQELFTHARSSTAIDAHVSPTAIIDDTHGPVIIESGARIGHATKLLGPCYIGRQAIVGDFSFVRGSSIEAGVVIGAYTEVARSIFLSHSEMHYGYIADSIVGKNVRIGAGLITANKRHDRENIEALVKGEKVDVGRNNLGVMIGDGAKIGVRTTTMPGVMIGSESVVYPGLTLYKNVEKGEVVKK
jgi:bifunctional UDP-N-acetylglucosamine pyrophosphorylase/glucosamine-1-phosphate N-acetyltransferase